MTTYSKETALYDTGAISSGIAGAGQTATNYLTTVSGTSGISVHDANDEHNYVNINSDGMTIVQSDSPVAYFGNTVRIGAENDSEKITIDDNGVSMYTSDGAIYFESSVDSSSTKEQRIGKTCSFANNSTPYVSLPATADASVSSSTVTVNIPDVIGSTDWNSVANGDTFYCITQTVTFRGNSSRTVDNRLRTFTKGTTSTDTATINYSVGSSSSIAFAVSSSATYNSSNSTISLSFTATNKYGSAYGGEQIACGITEIFYKKSVNISLIKMTGDCYLNNDSVGATYIGLDCNGSSSARATSGDDKDLFNEIYDRGWYSAVIV